MPSPPTTTRPSGHGHRTRAVAVLLVMAGLVVLVASRHSTGGKPSSLSGEATPAGQADDPRVARQGNAPPARRVGSAAASTPYPARRCAEENAGLAMAAAADTIPALLARMDPRKIGTPYVAALVARWADKDPEAAAAWLVASVADGRQAELAGTIAVAWAGVDSRRALAWAVGLADTRSAERAQAEIALVVAREHPDQAMEIAARLGDRAVMRGCAVEWARVDPAAAAGWTTSLQAGASRDEVACEVAAAWSEADPVAAATFAATGIADPVCMDRAILAILGRAGTEQRPRLAAWVETFPEGDLKHRARAELARIDHLLPASPASLPGEAAEDRSPQTATVP